ncbi:MAG: DNA primase [Frankiaceae bacterium]
MSGGGRISDADVEAVRERSPIAEVVGEHLQLRKAGGASLKGLCPFHEEKTPSFTVSPTRGLWYCFGCQRGGDVIKFVRELEQLTFVEAIEKLAARAGIDLRYEQGGAAPRQQASQRTRLVTACAAAAEFYAAQLAEHPEAETGRRFLAERGFDLAAAAHFGVGYAPRGWDELLNHLRGRGFAAEDLLTAGLARAGSRSPYDYFRGRLVWPIRDRAGDVVGFGARRLYDDDAVDAKYLNTPDTAIFKKSRQLYGVDLAKRDIARRMQAVVVEGYTDVMACHLAGVPTAVATCGTAFGTEHIAVLRQLLMDQDEFRGEVIFTFDGDEAGQRAALKAFEDDQRFVAQLYVAVEPGGLDPCELRVSRGDAAIRDLVARREPLVQFALRSTLRRYDLETVEGRVGALATAAPLVASIKDRSLRPEYARRLAGMLGMEVEPVMARVAELAGQPPPGHRGARDPADRRSAAGQPPGPARGEAPGPRAGRPDPADPRLAVEREAIKVALQQPRYCAAFDDVAAEDFTAAPYAAVRRAIATAGGTAAAPPEAPAWIEQVSAAAADDTVRSLITELAVEPARAAEDALDSYARAIVARLREVAVTRKVTALKSTLQRMNPVEQATEYNRAFGELIGLEQHKRELREAAIGEL